MAELTVPSKSAPRFVPAAPLALADRAPLARAAHVVAACHVRFAGEATSSDDVVLTFREPQKSVAISAPVPMQDLPHGDGVDAPTNGLHVCFLPNGPSASAEEQRQIDEWLAAGGVPVIELLMRGDRIRWRPGGCVVQAGADRWREILEAVVSFSFYEAELRKLESELAGALPTAERDADLAGRIDATGLARWEEVHTMTRDTAHRRIRFARIEHHLEKVPVTLSATAQRTFNELALQADVGDRLVYVDDRIELFEDLYLVANERLSEYSYFRRGQAIEIGILSALVLEILILCAELYILAHK